MEKSSDILNERRGCYSKSVSESNFICIAAFLWYTGHGINFPGAGLLWAGTAMGRHTG